MSSPTKRQILLAIIFLTYLSTENSLLAAGAQSEPGIQIPEHQNMDYSSHSNDKKHCEQNASEKLSDFSSTDFISEITIDPSRYDKKSPLVKWAKAALAASEQIEKGNKSRAINLLVGARKIAKKLAEPEKPLAVVDALLAKAYLDRKDYEKASESALASTERLSGMQLHDRDLAATCMEIEKHYKTISLEKFEGDIKEKLTGAGVQKITVAFEDDTTADSNTEQGENGKSTICIALAERYQEPVDSKDVRMIGFAKQISFEFLKRHDDYYQLSKIKGLQAKTAKMWVNLLESVIDFRAGKDGIAGLNPVAQITAGKMGQTRTVEVALPEEISSQSRSILDNLYRLITGETKDNAIEKFRDSASQSENLEPDSGAAISNPALDQVFDTNQQREPSPGSTPQGVLY